MRVVDLDRDMSDVIPMGFSPDSEFLFARMEDATLEALRVQPGSRVLDAAAGVGQDGRRLAADGSWTVGAEPSRRIMQLALLEDARRPGGSEVRRVRGWSEALPFRAASFDAAFCKGALDHFDDPVACIQELARITHSRGRVVLAVANFESLGSRGARTLDRWLGPWRSAQRRGRRYHDVPSDHLTRYDPALLREQIRAAVEIEEWTGLSLLWGVRSWGRALARLPRPIARGLLLGTDALARWLPSLADVIVVAGRPRGAKGP